MNCAAEMRLVEPMSLIGLFDMLDASDQRAWTRDGVREEVGRSVEVRGTRSSRVGMSMDPRR